MGNTIKKIFIFNESSLKFHNVLSFTSVYMANMFQEGEQEEGIHRDKQ